MKKFFVALLMLLSVPAFATGVGSTVSTADCNNATLNTYTGTSNLSAGWQPNTIDLHWYADSNATTEMNVATASQSCTYDGTLTPPATIPTKTGYTFKGWKVRGLPDGYTRLQYIESTGTQYIDTGIMANQDTSVEMKVQLFSSSGVRFFAAYESGGNTPYYGVGFSYSGKWVNQTDTTNQVTTVDADTNLHTVYKNKNILYVDGTQIDNTGSGNFTTSNMYLLAANIGGTTGFISSGKLYYTKIWNNGTLIRDMIPAKRNSDNVVGMWDTVSKTFFTNAGTGSFIAGPVAQ